MQRATANTLNQAGDRCAPLAFIFQFYSRLRTQTRSRPKPQRQTASTATKLLAEADSATCNDAAKLFPIVLNYAWCLCFCSSEVSLSHRHATLKGLQNISEQCVSLLGICDQRLDVLATDRMAGCAGQVLGCTARPAGWLAGWLAA
jgi:hypothetical protein